MIYNVMVPGADLAKIVLNAVRKNDGVEHIPGAKAFYETLKKIKAPTTIIQNKQAIEIMSS